MAITARKKKYLIAKPLQPHRRLLHQKVGGNKNNGETRFLHDVESVVAARRYAE